MSDIAPNPNRIAAPFVPGLEAVRDISPARRWDQMGSEHADITRAALVLAEDARQKGVDPGDATLRAVEWTYAVMTEPERAAAFAEEWEPTIAEAPKQPRFRVLRSIIGALSLRQV